MFENIISICIRIQIINNQSYTVNEDHRRINYNWSNVTNDLCTFNILINNVTSQNQRMKFNSEYWIYTRSTYILNICDNNNDDKQKP